MTPLVISVDVEHINLWRCDIPQMYTFSPLWLQGQSISHLLYTFFIGGNQYTTKKKNCDVSQTAVICKCFPSASSPPKLKIHFEFTLLSSDVDFYSVVSDKKAEKEELSPSDPLHKQALCHQYCRGIHTAGVED